MTPIQVAGSITHTMNNTHFANIIGQPSAKKKLGFFLDNHLQRNVPMKNVFLWGGFTDGDRACYVVTAYSPREIILAGMDFGDVVGKWSKPSHESHFPAPQRKRVKLAIAHELITTLFEMVDIPHTIL